MSADNIKHILDTDLGSLEENLAGVSGRFAADIIGPIDPETRTDVLESILYAQLAASGRCNAFTDPMKCQELVGLAWTNVDSDFQEASLFEQDISVSRLVLQFLTNEEGTKAKNTVYTLSHRDPTETVVRVFNTSGGRGEVSNFQLGTVLQSGGNIKLGIMNEPRVDCYTLTVLLFLEGGAFYYSSYSNHFFTVHTPI
ncbi:hypothetical protein RHS01_09206 [Rhizoctonia solani]|uniref:Uncharacterized protein n=1 Tax=Rhizoctonia solani TaxID=456999 RepID=A0A8H7M143_9AGAM|nr:hypothetical protein RHS01_09206 [Rhizoctonia solani]